MKAKKFLYLLSLAGLAASGCCFPKLPLCNECITNWLSAFSLAYDAFVTTTGYSREESLGRRAGFQRSGLTPVQTYSELWTALNAGETWRGEFINQRRDGERQIVFAHISPIRIPRFGISLCIWRKTFLMRTCNATP